MFSIQVSGGANAAVKISICMTNWQSHKITVNIYNDKYVFLIQVRHQRWNINLSVKWMSQKFELKNASHNIRKIQTQNFCMKQYEKKRVL